MYFGADCGVRGEDTPIRSWVVLRSGDSRIGTFLTDCMLFLLKIGWQTVDFTISCLRGVIL
jgi:hypothetical protein